MKNIDLIVLGEVALDVILAGVDKIPHRWSEVGNVQTAGVFTAGSAGYVAQCFAKLGGRAAIVGRIGDDSLGRIVIEGFHDCGVSTSNLVIDEAFETQVSTVVVYNDGNKSSVVSKVPPLRLDRLDPTCTFAGTPIESIRQITTLVPARLIENMLGEKLMFGSDFPRIEMNKMFAAFSSLPMRKDVLEAILQRNALTFLGEA
ncbi:MAG: PfkB family carbohydrate kinase [Candidatus Bathyarchaeia archaeon]|jgi:hypothetical protein